MWKSEGNKRSMYLLEQPLFIFTSDATTKIKSYEQHSAEFIYNLNLCRALSVLQLRAGYVRHAHRFCPKPSVKVGLESRSDYCSCSTVLGMATKLL